MEPIIARKRLGIYLLFMGALACPFIAAAETAPFPDVNQTGPYATHVQSLKDRGIIDGKGDGTFGPHDAVTRAEFVKMVVAGFRLPLDHGHFHFFDLDSHWAAQYVQTAWNNGIIQGTEDYKFSPDAGIKREEAAVIVWRLLQQNGVAPSAVHSALSSNVDEWAKDGVSQCKEKNLFDIPFSSGTFQDPLSREEAAALIDSSMNYLIQTASASNGQTQSDTYTNEKYGFILKLPKNWSGKYHVADREYTAGHNIDFINESTKTGILFTISVWSKTDWETNGQVMSENIPTVKLGENGNIVYIFHTPTDVQYDPSDEKAKQDYESMFKDVTAIKISFEMTGSGT